MLGKRWRESEGGIGWVGEGGGGLWGRDLLGAVAVPSMVEIAIVNGGR